MAMFSGKIRLATLTVLLLNGSLFAVPDWETAAELRKNNEIDKAETTLKKYSSPAGFEQLKPAEKIEFLRGLLELAHIRALNDDVVGSLALLNWAEGRSDPYQRSIACVKYAEILLDLGEFERARGYLANADELIKTRATKKDIGAAIGQGGEKVDTGGAWRELRDESDALKADIESEEMKNKFGATYGSYVKLRRLQQVVKRARIPRYRNEAMRVADEIIATDPASQFAVAAEYLKGELMASRLTENSDKKEIRKAKDYLEKFVKAQPEGLYRGEALMLLGKISLEIEWNAKDAEKYYNQALDYFRKAREKRDALSLYAPICDDLRTQTEPTQKLTSLNQWKRIVYHDEDPLKLYNTVNAPVWYIDEREKLLLLQLGFLRFAAKKYQEAGALWEEAGQHDSRLSYLNARGIPNALARLQVAANTKRMLFSETEQKKFASNIKLRIQYGEFLFGLEKFEEALEIFTAILHLPNVEKYDQAAALIGIGYCNDLLEIARGKERLSQAQRTWGRAYALSKGTELAHHALWMHCCCLLASTDTKKQATELLEELIEKFPDSPKIISANIQILMNLVENNKLDDAKVMYHKLKSKYGNLSEFKNLNNLLNKLKVAL